MPNLVPRSAGLLAAFQGNQVAKQTTAIQEDAFLERVHASTQRDLAVLRAVDIGHTARVSMGEAAEVIDRLTSHVEANPLSARAVAKIAETATQGLDSNLRQFLDQGL